MNYKFKKIISVIAVAILGLNVFASCGKTSTGGGNGLDGSTAIVTVYRAKETGMVDGTDDDAVKAEIEKRFEEDTGIKMDLQVKMYTDSELQTKVDNDWTKKNADMDAIVHYIGEDSGSAIKKYAVSEDTVQDVTELLEQYGQNILKYVRMNDENHIAERSSYVNIGGDYSMNFIPSVYREQSYGMLIRKDFMENVKSETGLDPEDYDVLNENYKSLTITEFENLLKAIKNNNKNIKYPLTGYAWDLNRVIAPVFDCDAYSLQLDSENKYVPSQFSEGTVNFYEKLNDWAKDGLWEKESSNMTDSTRLTYFLSGYSAVYATYPTVENLITTARKIEAYDSTAEYMLIAPLAKDDGTVNGNQKVQKSFMGTIIPKKANNADVYVKFLDWMYSDVDNYELCKYGIKGTHWVEGDQKTINGITYDCWAYPASKSDEFNINPPYSGKYCLCQNINISNRIRDDYNPEESSWYSFCTDVFPVYNSTNPEGVWLQETPRSLANSANNVDGDFVDQIRSKAWAGLFDYGETKSTLNSYIARHKSTSTAFLDFIDDNIKASLEYFRTKLV